MYKQFPSIYDSRVVIYECKIFKDRPQISISVTIFGQIRHFGTTLQKTLANFKEFV